jgi:uncharacterized protein (DUF849 family)
MLLKAAINGKRMRNEHAAIPMTPHQQAMEAAAAVAAGAGAIHVHPRDTDGRESLAPDDLAATLEAIRAACPSTPVGVSTGAWILPDVDQRLALIGAWEILPDFAGVNFYEPGAVKVARLLLGKGIAVEAGIWNVGAAQRLRRSGLSEHCLRLLLEPAQEPGDPHARLRRIDSALAGVQGQRLLHGFDAMAWVFIELAAMRGYDTRVGLEDTLVLPDGTCARDNAELVAAARRILVQQKRSRSETRS